MLFSLFSLIWGGWCGVGGGDDGWMTNVIFTIFTRMVRDGGDGWVSHIFSLFSLLVILRSENQQITDKYHQINYKVPPIIVMPKRGIRSFIAGFL